MDVIGYVAVMFSMCVMTADACRAALHETSWHCLNDEACNKGPMLISISIGGTTGHAETVVVNFDPSFVTYKQFHASQLASQHTHDMDVWC